jgi:hypothetical protein
MDYLENYISDTGTLIDSDEDEETGPSLDKTVETAKETSTEETGPSLDRTVGTEKETLTEEEAEWDEELEEDDIRRAVAQENKLIKAETEQNKRRFHPNDDCESSYTMRRSECSIPSSEKAIAHFNKEKFEAWVQSTRVSVQGAEAIMKQCSQLIHFFLDKFPDHKAKPMTTVLYEMCINHKEIFSSYLSFLNEVDKLKPTSVIERIKSCSLLIRFLRSNCQSQVLNYCCIT